MLTLYVDAAIGATDVILTDFLPFLDAGLCASWPVFLADAFDSFVDCRTFDTLEFFNPLNTFDVFASVSLFDFIDDFIDDFKPPRIDRVVVEFSAKDAEEKIQTIKRSCRALKRYGKPELLNKITIIL